MQNKNLSLKLFNRNYVMVVVGQMISIFGNAILRFALPLYVLDHTGSTTIFGTILAMSTLPTLIFAPIGGILSDRLNRRNVMVILDFITAIVIGIFTYVLSLGPVVIIAGLLMMIFSVIQSIYKPVVQSSIPTITHPKNLERANGIVSLVNAGSFMIGPLFAGLLYGSFGIWPIMIVSGVCFFLAAFMETFIRIGYTKQEQHDSIRTMIHTDMKISLHFIMKDKPYMFKVMIVAATINFLLTSLLLIGLPAMVKVNLGLGSELYGIAQGMLAGGMLLGGLIASTCGNKFKMEHSYRFLVAASVSLIPMGMAFSFEMTAMQSYVLLSASCFVLTVFTSLLTILLMTLLQRLTPHHLIGKVISYVLVLTQASLPVGQALYGFIFEIGINHIDAIIYITAALSGGISVYSRRVFRSKNLLKDIVKNQAQTINP